MTIAVSIENTDAAKAIEVFEKNYSKRNGQFDIGPGFRLGPGERRTFYCYHLRDLIVQEKDEPPCG